MARQPRFHMRDQLGCKPIRVHGRELPNEWEDRRIGYSTRGSAQLPGTSQPLVYHAQKFQSALTVRQGIRSMPVRIFVPIKVVLERPIADGDQIGFVALEPALRVIPRERPTHDQEAFVDDRSVVEKKHGNRPLG